MAIDTFPPEFIAHIRGLEAAYLRETDPIRQSGFAGGADRWRSEREPILCAVEGDGDLLDLGCANGFLSECLATWAGERGLLEGSGLPVTGEASAGSPVVARFAWVAA
jgi:hypothetical protein